MARPTAVKLSNLEATLQRRINRRIAQFNPGDARLKAALYRIGFMIEAETKLNIRRERLIDTGRLLNSIRFTIARDGSKTVLTAGSFGVPYAAIHEFGGAIRIREHRRLQTFGFGRRLDPPVNATVRAHTRNMKARPYFRPAVKTIAPKVTGILRELLNMVR